VNVEFEEELARVLPPDLLHRDRLIEKSARHLHLIASANEHMNLTRISTPREAAIKHIYDSVAPWRHFQGAKRILDAGTGAGFPGVPLSIIFPDVSFTLCESIHKKARFVDSVVEALDLPNVHVLSERAEHIAMTRRTDIIIARAIAPVSRILELFRKPLKRGSQLMLYKGPDVETELAEAKSHHVAAQVLCRYDLPDGLGGRSVIHICTNSAERGAPHTRAQASPG
jgi:16S rRNA (guanine527-N7)-methyltransferase